MLLNAFGDIIRFKRAAGVGLPDTPPRAPSPDRVKLHRKMIQEECQEMRDAMEVGDIAEVADGAIDIIYVALGTLLEYGIDPVTIWTAVHAANMDKFGPGHWIDDKGKVRKPPSWEHPDVGALLKLQPPLALTYGD